MKSFIVVTFLLLGWVYFELSGGMNFQPRSVLLAQNENGTRTVAASDVVAPPAPVQVVRVIETPEITSLSKPAESPVVTAALPVEPSPADQAEAPVSRASLSFNLSQDFLNQSEEPVTLASLEQGGLAYINPLNRFDPGLEPVSTPTAEPATAAQEPVADIRAVSGSRVNMRSGPGTENEVVDMLLLGDRVEVLEQSGTGWLLLRAMDDGTIGWMSAALVKPVSN